MALPPNWSKYTTDDGKEYYHNSVTNKTQWDTPTDDLGTKASSFHSSTSEVYQYRPDSTELELHDHVTDLEGGRTVVIDPRSRADSRSGHEMLGGKVPTMDDRAVPSGRLGDGGFGGSGFGSGAGEESGGSWGILTSALSTAQLLFDVTSDDVLRRLRMAVMPYPPQECDFRQRPDFWGPFWVAATAVLFFAATGNLATLLHVQDREEFKADYSLVSAAAAMIFGCLVGVPFVVRGALFCGGHEAGSINFKQLICVYGYSLTPSIPVSLICLIPLSVTRWLSVLAGLALSLLFLHSHLWTDIAIEVPSLKWKLMPLCIAAQATIFLVYRLHFFNPI